MTKPDLLPCPFCGGEAHLDHDSDGETTYAMVSCAKKKGCPGAELYITIPEWNNRATPDDKFLRCLIDVVQTDWGCGFPGTPEQDAYISKARDVWHGKIELKDRPKSPVFIPDKDNVSVNNLMVAVYETLVHYNDPNYSRRSSTDVFKCLHQAYEQACDTRTPNKSAEVDLDALKHDAMSAVCFDTIAGGNFDNHNTHDIGEGALRMFKWLRDNGHLATGKGGDAIDWIEFDGHRDCPFGNEEIRVFVKKRDGKIEEGPCGFYSWRSIYCGDDQPKRPNDIIAYALAPQQKADQQKTAEPCGGDVVKIREEIEWLKGQAAKCVRDDTPMNRYDHGHVLLNVAARLESYLGKTQPAAPTQIDAGELSSVDIQKAIAALEIAIGYPAMVSNGIGKMPVLKDRAADDCRIIGEVIHLLEAHLSKLSGGGK